MPYLDGDGIVGEKRGNPLRGVAEGEGVRRTGDWDRSVIVARPRGAAPTTSALEANGVTAGGSEPRIQARERVTAGGSKLCAYTVQCDLNRLLIYSIACHPRASPYYSLLAGRRPSRSRAGRSAGPSGFGPRPGARLGVCPERPLERHGGTQRYRSDTVLNSTRRTTLSQLNNVVVFLGVAHSSHGATSQSLRL